MNQKSITGYSIWLFISASMIIIFFFLLININLCSAQQFCATQVFFTILISSLVMVFLIFMLQILDHSSAKAMFQQNIVFFFMRDWTWQKIVWIPVGLIAVFAGAYVGSLVNQPLLSIGLAGMMMLVALYHTKSVLVPIVIHGLYNSVIVILRAQGSASLVNTLSLGPTFVPNFGNNIAQYSGLINETVFQIFLVGVAEEIFKVFVITFIIVGFRGRFDVKNSAMTWIAGIMAVVLWVAMHSIANSYS